jgi:SAM-dependent methyltransferase
MKDALAWLAATGEVRMTAGAPRNCGCSASRSDISHRLCRQVAAGWVPSFLSRRRQATTRPRDTGQVNPEPGSLAEYFDGWYADMTGSPVKDEIQQRHLGLPPHLLSTSLLGWDGIAEAAAGLRLSLGETLVDLACGRGGYGLEIAARTGARLIGVDFSAEAVRQAREQARRLGATADFRIGDLSVTGLDAGSADAVLCVDAIQFAPQPDAAYREIRRILTSGGRAVLTNWEPLERDDQRLPARLRRVDLGAGLTAAGFESVEVRDRPGWRASERAMWQEAAALDPRDDPALRAFHDEGMRSLEIFGLVRRVIATASAP